MQALNSFRSSMRVQARPVSARTTQRVSLVSRSTRQVTVRVSAVAFSPPSVSDTKALFLENYKKPINAIYNTVIQELIVTQHFSRYSINYQYNEVFALGVVSVFDQILEAIPAEDRTQIFNAYIKALKEDPEDYRRDAAALEAAAENNASAPLKPDASGSDVQKVLATISEKVAGGKMGYSKFFAIGLFRLLELTGAKEPSALEGLVKAVGVKQEAVSKDLMLYKGILSKLSVAKELMRDYLEREKRKQAERLAEKAKKAEAEAVSATVSS